jgi:hypothetical protein
MAGGRKATTVKGFGGSARRSIPAAATQHDRFGLSFACHAMPFREKRGEERRGVKEEIVGRVLCRGTFWIGWLGQACTVRYCGTLKVNN